MGNAAAEQAFIRLYLHHFIHPFKAQAVTLERRNRVGLAALAVLVPAAGYTLFYILASGAGGAPSSFKPWLNVPVEHYFQFNSYVVAVVTFGCWAFSAGVVQLIAPGFGGSGSFEDTASVLGFGIGIATWTTMLHDLTDAVLSALGVINMQSYERMLNSPTFWRCLLLTLFVLYFASFLVLYTSGLHRAHRIGWGSSVVLALVALTAYQGLFFVFIR